MISRFAIILGALALAAPALAQTAQPSNPLQPRVVRPAPQPAQAQPAAPAQAQPATPGKRQRSAAQLANEDRMRKCGAEWRANKDRLSASGQTWRTFNVACRARLKAAGQ